MVRSPVTLIVEPFRRLRYPLIAAARCILVRLIQHDASVRGRLLRLVDQRHRLIHRKRVDPGHQVDVMLSMREGQRCAQLASRRGNTDCRFSRLRETTLTGHPPVEQRQLGIDARERAVESGGAGDPQRHAFGEDEIQQAIVSRRCA